MSGYIYRVKTKDYTTNADFIDQNWKNVEQNNDKL